MPRKLSWEEKFQQFKKEFDTLWIRDFSLFCQMSDRWQVLKANVVKEKINQFNEGAGEASQ